MTTEVEIPFRAFASIPRLRRNIVITEKIDGTNAQVTVTENGDVLAGSRNRWVTVENDNFGFAAWVASNADALRALGVGTHFGEWWGAGVQRRYDLDHKRFSLFNVSRWADDAVRPSCCHVVPTLYAGLFSEDAIGEALTSLTLHGSVAAPGFMKPEGICVFHEAANQLFKVTLGGDGHKGAAR